MCCRLEAEKKENCWMLPSNKSTKRNPQRSKARINREKEKELRVLKSARMSMNTIMLAGREKMK